MHEGTDDDGTQAYERDEEERLEPIVQRQDLS